MNNRLAWRIAIRDSDLDTVAKHVALTLDTYMNRSGIAWPSKALLATTTGHAVRTVDRALARLERGGFVVIAHSRGRHSNLYSTSLPTPSPETPLEASSTPSLETPTPSLETSNPVTGDLRSRKKKLSRSRKPDRSRDQEKIDVDPTALELAHRWLATHPMPR